MHPGCETWAQPRFLCWIWLRNRHWEGVLSIAKLAAGQEGYYLSLATGVGDYYTDSTEAEGTWLGTGAADLTLNGTVAPDDLRAVLAGHRPGGVRLTPNNRRVPGFDATFSAPKSISLLHALGSAAMRAQVTEAQDAAVAAAVGYLERQAAFVRRGRNGVERLPASGFVAAGFRHRTSRAGDPQLHTHVLIANLGRAADGRWSALDGRGLYAHKMDAGAIYQAQVRAELTRRLGVEWAPVRNGPAELAAVPGAVLRAFSRRRIEIEAALAARGASGARASEIANLATRTAKQPDADVRELRREWVARATELGFGASEVTALVGDGREPHGPRLLRDKLAAQLTENASVFDRRQVVRALCNAASEGADVAAVEAMADAFLRSTAVTRLKADVVIGPRYSTPELLRMEDRLLDRYRRHRRDGIGVVGPRLVEAALDDRPSIGADQAAMVRDLTTSGAAIDVVVGPAGTGKTFALDAARAAWQSAGYRVIGAALAARAAAELEAGSGIASFTVASTLRFMESERLPKNSVLVIDEAGMVGTRSMATLIRHAARSETKVVLVGDHRQLPEIEAGGLFGALAKESSAIHLSEDRRHRDVEERAALVDLRRGRIGTAVARLTRRSRITTADNAHALRNQLVSDWHEVVDSGHIGLMLARRRADVADLNARARARLADSDYLDARTERTVGGLPLCEGEWVLATRNRHSLGVINGDLGVVERATPEAVTVRLDRGPLVTLQPDYVAEHLTYGYALTIHKAQGATCDATFVLGDETLAREAAYTALSRGRDRNQLYAMRSTTVDDGHGSVRDHLDLVAALKRSEAQCLARDVGVEL